MRYSVSVRTYVSAIGLVGLATAVLVVVRSGAGWGESWWVAPAFGAVFFVGALRNHRNIVRGDEGQSTTHDESLVVALLFLASPLATLGSLVGAALLSELVLRRAPLKMSFNVAKAVLSISACLLVAGPELPLEPGGRAALGAVAGAAVFVLVDHISLTGVLTLVGAARFRDFVLEDIRGLALVWAGNVAIGLLAGIAATHDPWLLPIALGAMLPLHFTLSGHVRAKSERQALTELIAASSDGIVAVDRFGRVAVWSSAMEQISGVPSSAATGIGLTELLDLDSCDDGLDLLAGATGGRREVRLEREGGERWLELSTGPLPDGGHVLVVHDATADRRTREELDDREEQLRQAQKLETIGHLAAGIAHDFNNLLVAIGGYGELALGALDAKHPARADVEEILTATGRATDLSRRLLDYSRRRPVEPRRLALNAVVDDLTPLLSRLVGAAVQVEVEHAADTPEIEADSTQLGQIVMNLALNARDAMPDGGTLRIRTRGRGGQALVEVTDTGAGMDAATVESVFDPFFTTKPAGEGTGLGLSTVRRIVDAAGGSVSVSSEPGRGSTFLVALPAAGAAGATDAHDRFEVRSR